MGYETNLITRYNLEVVIIDTNIDDDKIKTISYDSLDQLIALYNSLTPNAIQIFEKIDQIYTETYDLRWNHISAQYQARCLVYGIKYMTKDKLGNPIDLHELIPDFCKLSENSAKNVIRLFALHYKTLGNTVTIDDCLITINP